MRVVLAVSIVACTFTGAPIERPAPEREPRAEIAPNAIESTPWSRSWDSITERERLARIGATDAAGLEAEYARACGPSSPPKVSGSPLSRYRTDGWNTETGVVIRLSPLAGSGDSLIADLRCHFVSLLLAPFGVDSSPFDVPGLHIEARGDAGGVTLVLGVRDPAQALELQRRVRGQVDELARPHHED